MFVTIIHNHNTIFSPKYLEVQVFVGSEARPCHYSRRTTKKNVIRPHETLPGKRLECFYTTMVNTSSPVPCTVAYSNFFLKGSVRGKTDY